MKKIVLGLITFSAINLFAGESADIIKNLKSNTKQYSFVKGISLSDIEDWNRAIKNAGIFIQQSDPKLSSKVTDLQVASNTLLDTVKIIHRGFIAPFKKDIEENPFETPDRKMVDNIEKAIQPLNGELKKIKGSIFSGVSLFKKSEAQKVFNEVKDILVKRIQEVLDEFKDFKKNPIIN